jgi:hypothetical protein
VSAAVPASVVPASVVSGASGVRTQMYPSEAAGSECAVDDEIVKRVAAGRPLDMLHLGERLQRLKGHRICRSLRRCVLLLEGEETLVLVILVLLVV